VSETMQRKPIRLRDFIEDGDGWLYAVSAYDNRERVGCLLRYVPDRSGDRVNPEGVRYRKLDFGESFSFVAREKPQYLDLVHRVPAGDVRRVYKPEEEIGAIMARSPEIRKLISFFGLPPRTMGCTGSYLCGLQVPGSDIDLVVYGRQWRHAREILRYATMKGKIPAIDDETWQAIYAKRKPDLPFDEFILHEQRKWNRGRTSDAYFDLLFSRSYKALHAGPEGRGQVVGPGTVEAVVTDASLSFDSPAVYRVDDPEISMVLSFTHTYTGQAVAGERIEAKGVCERHGDELWLIVGTTREARGQYIRSLSLLEQKHH